MVEAQNRRVPLPRGWTLATVAALGLASAGCTMCPDPFDYSGPVPNGSSPQNDFRARSNGILPLGAAPKPWPPLVKDGVVNPVSPQDRTPTLAEEPSADGAESGDVEQTVAVLGESEGETVASGQPRTAGDAVVAAQPVLESAPPRGDVPVAEESAKQPQAPIQENKGGTPVSPTAAEPPPAMSSAPVIPPLPPIQAAETPGWRARRR